MADSLCGMSDRFEKHAWTVTLLTLASRITGLVRDATLSRIFGAGELMSAFFFAFMIPNLFRRLFGEGALAAAFLPAYAKLNESDPEVARRLASLTIARLTVLLGAITLISELVLFMLSARTGHQNVAIWLTMVMLPYMPMVCLVAILGAMLQVHHRFGPTAAAPIILNLAIVVTAVGAPWVVAAAGDPERRVVHVGIVAASVLVAGAIQVAWSMAALRCERWWRKDTNEAREHFGKVLRLAGPMIVGLGVLQLNTFFDGLIASYPATVGDTIFGTPYPLDVGAMAVVSYAQRLYQFPLGVFGIAVATAIFPLLARQAGASHAGPDALGRSGSSSEPSHTDPFSATIRRGLRLVVFIGIPASAGLVLVRDELTAVILQGGEFTPADTGRVGFVLLGYAPAIWAYSMVHVLTRAYYAKDDSKTPVRIALGVVGLNLALNCTLIWTPLKEAGLAWSTAICSFVQVGLLLWLVRKHARQVVNREVLASWCRTIICTLPMTGVVLLAASYFGEPAPTWAEACGRLALLVGGGMAIVAITALAMRMPELAWAVGRNQKTENRKQK
jgi:putative peptidoglycan lipid II flippase